MRKSREAKQIKCDRTCQDSASAEPIPLITASRTTNGQEGKRDWASFFAGPALEDDFLNDREQPTLEAGAP
jgi:hypothetical protein